MQELNFEWFEPKISARNGGDFFTARKSSSGKVGKSNKSTQAQLTIIIPENAMKQARMVIGDRIVVGFTETEKDGVVMAIKRVVAGGYKISSCTGCKVEKVTGKSVKGRVKTYFHEGMPESFTSESGGYSVDETGMMMAWEGK